MKFLCTIALALILTTLGSCQRPNSSQHTATGVSMNSLTEEEKASGWELLFDGSTLNGWKRYNHDTIGPLWSVKDNAIVCASEGPDKETNASGGSLMTVRQFGNFELSLEWKLSPDGNSGVLYHVIEKPELKHDYESGPECQVLDNEAWKGKIKDAQKTGSNYDMYPAPEDTKVNPIGEWNALRIVYNNGHVEHWLNGRKIIEFQEDTPDYEERYKKSKWTKYPLWNRSKVGAISLQDHGTPVFYRNIKIKVL